ncbi:hypothetical protein [Stakelama saccharophila]|uniref:Inner membrane protein n=1 Tax=Stakelama saccharophila TaxID=3075605 RepID=A0ABZ0BAH9_9SPHN|nr:hypothetical protein [Stakelama sp. W311]WNO53858.1 hypothetical protein RPR59_00945 [Stakelama sp. W311]
MTSDNAAFRTGQQRTVTFRTLLIVCLAAFLVGAAIVAAGWLAYDRYWRATAPRSVQGSTKSVAADARAQQPEPALGRLAEREDALSSRIAGLEERLATIDTSSRVASGFANRAEGLMVAFAARRALDRGLALGYIEEQLRGRFGRTEPKAVATVVTAASQPVTLENLRMELDRVGPDLLSGGDGGLWDAFQRELANLVVVRQQNVPSPRPNARLRRAKRMLDAGNVQGAVAEVARLPGADQAKGWLRMARRYINARDALDVIETAAIQGRSNQPAAIAPARPTLPATPSTDSGTQEPPSPPATAAPKQGT